MSNLDGTYECAHDGCKCRVVDDDAHPRDAVGQIFCSEACRAGRSCGHDGCECGGSDD